MLSTATLIPAAGWLSLIPPDAGYVGMLVLGTGPFVIAMLTGRLQPRGAADARVVEVQRVAEARVVEVQRVADARVAEAKEREAEWRDLADRSGSRADRLAENLGGTTELAKSVEKLIGAVTNSADDRKPEVTHRAG